MKLFLSGNFTLDPLTRFLQSHDVVVGGFNDYRAMLAGLHDGLLADREAVAFLIDGIELAAEHGFDPAAIRSAVEEYAEYCEAFATAHQSVFVIATTIRLPSFGVQSFNDFIDPNGASAIEADLNRKLAVASRDRPNLFILDLARLVGHFGERAAYNSGMRYFSRFGLTAEFAAAFAREVDALSSAIMQQSKKVLALDFDNTIWGGVVGEVGVNGIDLSQEGRGRAYRHFQGLVKQLSKRGILLVGLSKNNQEDVEEVFAQNRMMVLRQADFTLLYANWIEKPRNIQEAAETLNLGLDSFVFIDDNPVERKMMREMLSAVNVPEFPASCEKLPEWFAQSVIPQLFPTYRVTNEDTKKTEQYRANAERSKLKNRLSIRDFVAQLGVELQFLVNGEGHAVRFSQMTQKTNQFNLTTRRYSVIEMEQMIKSARYDVVGMEYSDQFGKEGIVGLAILNGESGQLDTFLMSCRVIGRGVEDELMRQIEQLAARRGHRELFGTFRPTRKNAVSARFLTAQGFDRMPAGNDGEELYRKRIDVHRQAEKTRGA